MATRRTGQLKKTLFLAEYAKSGVISHACKTADIQRSVFYWLMEHDEKFALAVRQAEIEAVESLEMEARKRAVRGSDTLLIFLLKAARPDKYRDQVEHRHAGKDGGDLVIGVRKVDYRDASAALAPANILAGNED